MTNTAELKIYATESPLSDGSLVHDVFLAVDGKAVLKAPCVDADAALALISDLTAAFNAHTVLTVEVR